MFSQPKIVGKKNAIFFFFSVAWFSLRTYLGHGIFFCIRFIQCIKHFFFSFNPNRFLGEVLSFQNRGKIRQKKKKVVRLYRSTRLKKKLFILYDRKWYKKLARLQGRWLNIFSLVIVRVVCPFYNSRHAPPRDFKPGSHRRENLVYTCMLQQYAGEYNM